MLLAQAGDGFTFAESFDVGLVFAGAALFVALLALSQQYGRPYSASLAYLGLGLAGAALLDGLGITWLDPIEHAVIIEHAAELAVVIALFSAGLKVERELSGRKWAAVVRLLLIAMPLTIAAVAVFGHYVMGLSVAAAIALGAVLAPTDPVLAGDVGLGPPGEHDKDEPEENFALTAEAGFNDGLAFPFVLLAVFVAERGGSGWLGEWALADVLYALPVGLVVGVLTGYAVAALAFPLRERGWVSGDLDGWLAGAAVLVIYALAEVVGAYGFIAAFAGGLAFRRYEHGHDLNRAVHDGAEAFEKLGELVIILLLGTLVTLDGLGEPGLEGWLLAPLLILVIRPVTALLSLAGSSIRGRGPRLFVAWFGVRGIGSLFYVAVIISSGAFSAADEVRLFWTVTAVVMVSIVLHGITSAPLERRLLRH